jgi:hypothetical protein
MSEPLVTAPELLDINKSRGFLAKQLYVTFTIPTNGIGLEMVNLQTYLDYQEAPRRSESAR